MIAKLIVVIVAVLLSGTQVIRNATAEMSVERAPAQAAEIWPSNPSVEMSLGMTRIAEAARDRRPVPPSVFSVMADAAGKDPLAAEPFLVAGVQAQLSGDGSTAERAFEAAQWRDPRSLAAAYFLADRYFRVGNTPKALTEVAALARVAPNGTSIVQVFVPGLYSSGFW